MISEPNKINTAAVDRNESILEVKTQIVENSFTQNNEQESREVNKIVDPPKEHANEYFIPLKDEEESPREKKIVKVLFLYLENVDKFQEISKDGIDWSRREFQSI